MVYEINMIWVGNKSMPDAQLKNIDTIHTNHPEAKINLWVIEDLLNADMKAAFKSRKYINIKDIGNIVDPIKYPKTYETLQLFIAAKQWACVSDVLRLLILCRDEEGQISRRFYMEPDNIYPISSKLKQMVKDKGFAYHSSGPNTARCDSMYINLQREIGKEFKANLQNSLELLLADHVVNTMLKAVFANPDYKPSAFDVVYTSGHLNSTLLKLVVKKQDFFENAAVLDFSIPGKFSNMSWVPNTSGKNPECIQAAVCSVRFIQILEIAYGGSTTFLVTHTRFAPRCSDDFYKFPVIRDLLSPPVSKPITPQFAQNAKATKELNCNLLTKAACAFVTLGTVLLVNRLSQ